MWKMRILTAAVASLFLGSAATGFAAVRHDLDDRHDARRDDAKEHEREVRLALPRTASGAIDVKRLVADLRAAITRGAHDIRFRDTVLSAEEVKILRELAAKFGFERVRIREEGKRVRVEFRDGDRHEQRKHEVRKDDDDRDELRKRVEVRNDKDRFRERVEVRDDDGRIRNEVRVERREDARPEKMRVERPEKVERRERAERAERNERYERYERPEQHGGSGRH